MVGELLAGAMAQLWESGWTPADMARVAERKLPQAHGDLAGELAVADGRARAGRSRTRSFRRSFLYGFADRIGQRLRETAEQQTAAAAAGDARLLPVLSARDERIDATVAQAFPHMEQRAGSVSHGGGYTAGQAAADLADLDVSAGALREARAG